MTTLSSLDEQIVEWKAKRRALILAHYYQDPDIQELADVVGDPIELARTFQRSDCETAVVCGVRFMAETVQLLNPERTVLLPDQKAGCSLVDSCPAGAIRVFRRRNPKHVIVSYMNTSVEVKAESDVVCTAQNAVRIVNSIPAAKPILFLPDSNLGNWVKQQTGRANMQVWQGACIVHATFAARRLTSLRAQHPQALVAAHPECPSDVIRMVDFTGSAAEIADWCERAQAGEYILATENGLERELRKRLPESRFYFVQSESCNCSECPYTRRNTLENLVSCLETLAPRIQIEAGLADRARRPFARMFSVDPFAVTH